MSTTTCKVCKTEIKSGICPYCGFENIVILGASNDSKMGEYVNSYKGNLINNIKNISVKTYTYDWNSTNTDIEEKSIGKYRLCDGTDCFGKIYKCPERFAQNPAETVEERTMYISYELKGVEKTVPITLKPVKCPDHWELGLKIDENLRLSVYVGVDGNCAEKNGVSLQLI